MIVHSTGLLSQSVKAFVLYVFINLLFGFSAHAGDIKIQRQGEYTFITGGLGDDERTYLEAQAPKYPIQLVFRNKGLIIDSKDVTVKVKNVSGELMVEAKAGGPFFYINPPASGRFTLEAQFEGQSISMTKDLVGRRYLNLVFDFNKSQSD
jgi:hypothetical protein